MIDFDKELARLRQQQQQLNSPNVPQNNEDWRDSLGRYFGLMGIGMGNMVNNTAVGGLGQLLGLLGRGVEAISPWSGDTQSELRNQLINAGIPLDEARAMTPYEDSWLTSLAKNTLDARNYLADNINELREETIRNAPRDENGELLLGDRIAEGVGSSLGFMATGLGGKALAGLAGLGRMGTALSAAGAMGTAEALSESGGLLGEAHRQGLYDEGLDTANKSLAANMALNTGLNFGLGRFNPWIQGIRNPLTRFGIGAGMEAFNEFVQEPSQHTIEQAAHRDLYNGEDFLPALTDEARNWYETAGKLAPEVIGSALITQGLLGGLGMANPNIRRDVMDEYRNRHVDIDQAQSDLMTEYARQRDLMLRQANIQEDIDRLRQVAGISDNPQQYIENTQQKHNLRNNSRNIQEGINATDRAIDILHNSLKPSDFHVGIYPVEGRTVQDLRSQIEAEQLNFDNLQTELKKLEGYDTDEQTLQAKRREIQLSNLKLGDLQRAYNNALQGIYSDTTTTTQDTQQTDNSYTPNPQNIIFNFAPKGRNSTVKTKANGNNIDTDFAIVEAGRIIPSNDPLNGKDNPNYTISQAQNRNRSSNASIDSVRSIAQNLDTDLLGDSTLLQDGAPLVTADGQVVSGNKRAMAIQRAYTMSDRKSADNYRQFLIQHANDFGLQPDYVEKLENPMLVRVLNPNTSLAQISSIGNQSNVSNTEVFSATETALDDSEKLNDKFFNSLEPSRPLDSRANIDAVRAFFENVPESQRNAFLQSQNGQDRLSAEGLRRVQAALQAYAYGDESIISRLQEQLDSEDNEKKITQALEKVAPKLAKLQHFFSRNPDAKAKYDISQDLLRAIQNMQAASGAEQTATAMNATYNLDQSGDVLQNFDDTAKSIAGFLEANRRNSSNIAAFINAYADAILNSGGDNQTRLVPLGSKNQLITNAMIDSDERYKNAWEAQHSQQHTQQTAPQQQQDNQPLNTQQDARLKVINARDNPQTQQAIRQQSGQFYAYTDENNKAQIAPMQSRDDTRGRVPDAYTDEQTQQAIDATRPPQAGRIEGYHEREIVQPDKPNPVQQGQETQTREPFIQPKNRATEQHITQGNEATQLDTGEIYFDKYSELMFYSMRNPDVDRQGVSAPTDKFSRDNLASSLQGQQDEFHTHMEAFKAILRDLYNNGNGQTTFDIKPFWDYQSEHGIDPDTADKIFKELENQRVMMARPEYSDSWNYQYQFPSRASVSVIDAKNLAPATSTPQNLQDNQRLDRSHDLQRDTQTAQANQGAENTTTPRNDIQQSQQLNAEIHRHVEAIKSILRDLYANGHGEKQFDMKPIRDYISREIHDKSIADSVLQALDNQGIGYVQDDMTFFAPDKDFPSCEFFNITNPDNLAPRELSSPNNSKQQASPKQRNVPKTRFTLSDGRVIEFRVQSKNEQFGEHNPRSHEAVPNDGYVGDFNITQNHKNSPARMYFGQQDGMPIIGITDENGNFLGHYDPINDRFTAYDEHNGLARLAEAELKRQFRLDLELRDKPSPAQILDEVIRRDFQQKADDAGRNSTEAENISRVFMKQLEYLSRWSKKSAWDIYKALNIKIHQQEFSPRGKKRGETIFGETATIINLFKDADASTLLHETGHIFLHTLERMYRAGLFKTKNNRAALDWGVISREYGLTDIDFSKPLSQADRAKLIDAHEQFAASLEKYFRTGKAPVAEGSKMFHVFKSFKEWLKNIYKAARDIMFTDSKGRKKSVVLHDDIKELFDRIFADTTYKPKNTSGELDLSGLEGKFLQSEKGERGGFFKWLKNLGRKALSGMASIAHVPQKSSGYDYTEGTLLSPETIRRISEASKPLPRGNIVARIWQGGKKIAQSVTGGDFARLANAPDAKERGFLEALEWFRQGQRKKKKAVDDALKTFSDNLRGLTRKQLDLFNTFRILDDLMFQIQDMPDSAIPFGLDEKTLRAEHARLSPIVKADSAIARAIQAEEDTMRKYNEDYKKFGGLLGLDFSKSFRNPHYYRHKILEYAQAVRAGKSTPSARGNLDIQGYADATLSEIFGRDWRKKRKGSTLDFLTDYIQANSEVRMQMAQDIENMKTLLQLKKKFDIAPKLLERLKQRRKNNATTIDTETEAYSQSDFDGIDTLFDVMTDDEKEHYEGFMPAQTRLLEADLSAAENVTMMAASDIAENTGIDLERILHSLGYEGDTENQMIFFPKEVVDTLRELAAKRNRGMLGQVAKDLTTWWKRSVLFSPFRNIKYNIRNFTGDLDALIAGNPKALQQLPRALKELTAHYMKGKNQDYHAPKELQEYIDRSAGLGIQSLNLSARDAQAILNMIQDMQSPSKIKKAWSTALKPIRAFFSAEHAFTEWREHLLRYAAYLDYKQQMEQNKDGRPNNWGASLENEVMSLDDIRDRAFKMSNELVGAYDQVSETGKQLRDMLVPFYSWIEVNMRRYARLFKNAIKGGNTKNLLGQIMLGKTAAIPAYAVSASMSFGQLALFTLATQMFNRWIWPDADDDLPNDVKYRPHLTLGKSGNDVYYFDRIGALADVLDWASLDSVALDAKDFANGQLTVADWLKKILQAPVSKAINSLNPGIKLPIELAMGRSMFPNVFKPSTIRDPAMYIARSFGLSWPYKSAMGIPHDTKQEATNLALYSVDADEAAYFQTLDRVRQFQNQVLDKHFDGFAVTQRGRILQKIKTALRYNDNQALRRFLQEYTQADGTKKGLQQSMKAMHPLHGLSKDEQKQFLRWLSPDDKKYLRKAERYFRQLTARFIR